MKHLSHFIRLCALSLTFATSSIAFAANADINEENTLIKDDIASAQVLTEMCPSLIGKNAKFDQNIKKMVSSSLSGYRIAVR
jgi:predicted nucleic acid-binding protein